jgi:predicted Zn-dependent protease
MAKQGSRLRSLLRYPRQPLQAGDYRLLKKLVATYPAFAPGHVLLARAARQREAIEQDQLLRRAAAYTGDRRMLRTLVEDEAQTGTPIEEAPAAPEAPAAESSYPDRPARIESRLRRHRGEGSRHWLAGPEPVARRQSPTTTAPSPKPLPYSYEQLLRQEGRLPEEATPPENFTELSEHLIQDFIRQRKPFQPTADKEGSRRETDEETGNGSGGDPEEDTGDPKPPLISETLANIHRRQGRYHKALEMYRQLQERHPEKSSYFAGLAQEMETKIAEAS